MAQSYVITQPLYSFNRENPINSELQNGSRRGLDFIALRWPNKRTKFDILILFKIPKEFHCHQIYYICQMMLSIQDAIRILQELRSEKQIDLPKIDLYKTKLLLLFHI